MKQFSILSTIFGFLFLASCTSNDEPEYPVFMQPASIQTMDANGGNQTFGYDDYGRIVSWNYVSNSTNSFTSYSAHYSYPDESTIKVTSEESWLDQLRVFEETIQLKNGRALQSEGTFIFSEDGNTILRKTYRLIYHYLPTNHLNAVEHLEVVGIGDEIKDYAWDNAWRWTNYLIWENGNLKEYQDYHGTFSLFKSTKYEYSEIKVSYPIIIPSVICCAHHQPLYMQGVFGLNSANLVESASEFSSIASPCYSIQYSYEFEEDKISEYTETVYRNTDFSNSITFKVTWTEK